MQRSEPSEEEVKENAKFMSETVKKMSDTVRRYDRGEANLFFPLSQMVRDHGMRKSILASIKADHTTFRIMSRLMFLRHRRELPGLRGAVDEYTELLQRFTNSFGEAVKKYANDANSGPVLDKAVQKNMQKDAKRALRTHAGLEKLVEKMRRHNK